MSSLKKSICPLDCPDSCGLLVSVTEGKVTSLQGDKEHPYTNGFICRKMRRYPERLYSSERVLYPQLRIGNKGAAEFRRISWDEALDICAGKLSDVRRLYGGKAILPYSYAGNMGVVNRYAGYPFFHKLGTLQLDQTICSAAAKVGWEKHCRDLGGSPPEKAAESDLIIAWGINIKVSNVHFWQYVATARRKGGQLVVIDPYRNQTARSADMYVQVKPGGDAALALAICKVLIERGGVDQGFLDTYTSGFGELSTYLATLKMSHLAETSGVELGTIYKLAKMLESSAGTFIRIGIGVTRNSRGAMAVRAIASLGGALGLFSGEAGKGVLLFTGAFTGNKELLVHKKLLCDESEVVNMLWLGNVLARKDPPVQALISYNANPLSVSPDASMVRKGLEREDLFTVVHEQVMTPTARYADLLLPATTFLENHDLYTAYGHYYLGVASPVIAPLGEAKSNFDFFQGLARRMGYDDPPFQQSCEERLREYLRSIEEIPRTADLEKVLKGEYVLSTRSSTGGSVSGTSECGFTFTDKSDPTEPAHCCLTPAGEFDDPDLSARYPLRLITPPHKDMLNSTFGERFKGITGELLIHPDDAAEYGVTDGVEVIVLNGRGRARRTARLSNDTAPGLIVAEGIFWPEPVNKRSPDETSGINDLTSQKLTDMGGGGTFHESLVTLRPVG